MTIKRERKLRQVTRTRKLPVTWAAARPLCGSGGNGSREQGIPGIFDRRRSGRPETHGRSVRLLIVSTATSVPPDGHSCWSQGSIARHLRERGLAVSRSTVGRVLAEARIRPHKVRGWLNRAYDPAFWARPARSAVYTCTPSPAPHDRNRA
jgi:hypothetical protein